MADDPDSLTLRYLRRIDERTDRIEQVQREHGDRLTTMELALAGLRRDQAVDAEGNAMLGARLDISDV